MKPKPDAITRKRLFVEGAMSHPAKGLNILLMAQRNWVRLLPRAGGNFARRIDGALPAFALRQTCCGPRLRSCLNRADTQGHCQTQD